MKGGISRCTWHSVCMWFAREGSCWFKAACLSISSPCDAWTVTQASGPQEKHTYVVPVITSTAAFVLTIWRLLHLQVAPWFTVSVSPRRPSVDAQWDYGRSRLGVQGKAVFLLRLPQTRGGIYKSVSLVTTYYLHSPISAMWSFKSAKLSTQLYYYIYLYIQH